MTSDTTPMTARYREGAAADGTGAWTVSGCPEGLPLGGRLLSRNQAITALTLAEHMAAGLGDSPHARGWREELDLPEVLAALKRCPNPSHEGGNPLPGSEFPKDRNRKDGLASWCRKCQLKSSNLWRDNHPDARREADRRRYAARPEAGRASSRRHRQKIKDAVFAHYGTSCACCGSTNRLTIDHVDGGGTKHRIELFGRASAGARFYGWLMRNGFPSGYQTLCHWCNGSKGKGDRCRIDHAAADRAALDAR